MSITVENSLKNSKDNKFNQQAHFMPCNINADDTANVQQYFQTYIKSAEREELTCTFRGRPLKGVVVNIPSGYKMINVTESKQPLGEDKGRKLQVSGGFNKFTHWNYDRCHSANDMYTRAEHWLNIAKAIMVNKRSVAVPRSNDLISCRFCGSCDDDEVNLGMIYTVGTVTCHYFCVLLSSCLVQHGTDDEGLFGFMERDIIKEIERGKKNRCSFCSKTGATLACSVSQCRQQFHLPCGKQNGVLSQFFGTYKSYCIKHSPKQKISESVLKLINDRLTSSCQVIKSRLSSDDVGMQSAGVRAGMLERKLLPCRSGRVDKYDFGSKKYRRSNDYTGVECGHSECPLCYEPVQSAPSYHTFWPPCCAADVWLHRTCLQLMCLNSGLHYVKCPMCNDKGTFQRALKDMGFYIPDRDASWELDKNAFSELYRRPDTCSAVQCHCHKGRTHNDNTGHWELKCCVLCGGVSVHVGCLTDDAGRVVCDDCRTVTLPDNIDEIEAMPLTPTGQDDEPSTSWVGPRMPSRMSIRRTRPNVGHNPDIAQLERRAMNDEFIRVNQHQQVNESKFTFITELETALIGFTDIELRLGLAKIKNEVLDPFVRSRSPLKLDLSLLRESVKCLQRPGPAISKVKLVEKILGDLIERSALTSDSMKKEPQSPAKSKLKLDNTIGARRVLKFDGKENSDTLNVCGSSEINCVDNASKDFNCGENSREELNCGGNARQEIDCVDNASKDFNWGDNSREELNYGGNARQDFNRGGNASEEFNCGGNDNKEFNYGGNDNKEFNYGDNNVQNTIDVQICTDSDCKDNISEELNYGKVKSITFDSGHNLKSEINCADDIIKEFNCADDKREEIGCGHNVSEELHCGEFESVVITKDLNCADTVSADSTQQNQTNCKISKCTKRKKLRHSNIKPKKKLQQISNAGDCCSRSSDNMDSETEIVLNFRNKTLRKRKRLSNKVDLRDSIELDFGKRRKLNRGIRLNLNLRKDKFKLKIKSFSSRKYMSKVKAGPKVRQMRQTVLNLSPNSGEDMIVADKRAPSMSKRKKKESPKDFMKQKCITQYFTKV